MIMSYIIRCLFSKDIELVSFEQLENLKKVFLDKVIPWLENDKKKIDNEDMANNGHLMDSRDFLGILFSLKQNGFSEESLKEYLQFLASVHLIENGTKRINEVIEQTGLGAMQHKKITALSKGYKQRLGIAAAIMHQPQLILLDEPTAGLDPNQLIEIRQLIQSLSANTMILFSTHILQEVTAICDRVLVLHQGKLVADEPISQLLEKHQGSLEEIFKMLTH